jgi:hypothetical protein
MKTPKTLASQLNGSLAANALFLITVTLGLLLLVGGLFTMILSASLPDKIGDFESTTQSIVFATSEIPRVLVNLGDSASGSPATMGIVSWIIGIDILFIGLGLWAKSRLAKWIAMGVFASSTFFNFVTFLNVGVLGSFSAFMGIFIDGSLIYLSSIVDF